MSAEANALPPREVMEFDVVIVGAGPAGLATAIRLRQRALEAGRELSVCVLEKGSEPGAHVLSGAVMDPRALTELFPDWAERGAPLKQKVTRDEFLFLSETGARSTPNALLPECFHNEGNYIISLGEVTRWLAQQAEALEVAIFPGFAAAEVLYGDNGEVIGVATGDMGIEKDGSIGPAFERGMALHAKYTIFAEGARGHLGRQLIARYKLDEGKDPQAYGIGIKELWQIDPARHEPGLVVHAAGWPLDSDTYGGAFLYHADGGKVAIGYVVGLDYKNPWLSPFEEFQRFKTHPSIRKHLEGGTRIGYGARAITAGGLLSLPKTVFPGGALVGCEAGYLNASRIKGSHAAIKTGMLCADAAFDALAADRQHDELSAYPKAFEASWLFTELQQAKNFKQWFKKGQTVATLMTGVEQWLLPKLGVRNPPWTLHRTQPDHACLEPASQHTRIAYPKPDGVLTFDRLSSVFLSSTNHDENQPSHLTLKDPSIPVKVNLAEYAGPEARYCPAGVYEFVGDAGDARLQINAQNCVHCKTCDIKDPTQNIVWVTPQGGGGPNYSGM
ncbi:electron transfer flavoprotein-ubiquinone oxidoreductase [Stenotrophomonas maltophilia group sp. P373]|uniref:Electron transfer flavoprotein-ubiquinone oxidoreductase n=1 Tax=Stenotrophomonas maltophilia TaxID=40324 RepID=A0A270ND90_STEMA|nr:MULTISPECIES: electron transfer flavoprotein-ubiquinone oxidoreductase [Stenotrophomonas]AYA92782.1 electron transfer flavoprotein-ubiquinone oxidoreductase [Stenotrophomonas sp. Pemsol]MBN4959995.1 electron transfer flavoprotein-ubiquinone oxidoreductase [Stenotrophomonas maltophilia]MBN4967798.1 electron transfer flavoprotein-ubiquinone oxidoreductase [Stenotrophomonas maltophilia]MCU1004035.1 electron transfer flavoprotein-ubiquinone oxidoreductase [Stenotrophomonas maltophilia]MCU115974